MKEERSDKSSNYIKFIHYKCANPECNFGYNVEGHHITPLKYGGEDAYWNMISLCQICHRGYDKHRNYKKHKISFFYWKCLQEIKNWGFCLDERDPDYNKHLKVVLLQSRNAPNPEIEINLEKQLMKSLKPEITPNLYECLYCGKKFKPSKTKKFCSMKCKSKYKHKFTKDNLGSANCKYCGETFRKNRFDQIYCSIYCVKKTRKNTQYFLGLEYPLTNI